MIIPGAKDVAFSKPYVNTRIFEINENVDN